MINVKSVGWIQNGISILNDVSFTIPREKITALVGPNGAGKTSLLRLICKLIQPSCGKIDISSDVRLGYVPQRIAFPLLFPMDAHAFLTLGQTSAILNDWMTFLGISNTLLNRKIGALSGGERQWMLLLKALMATPHMLILDEPTQNLDFKGHSEFYNSLLRLQQIRNITILIASHDFEFVQKNAHHVICVDQTLCYEGTPDNMSTACKRHLLNCSHLIENCDVAV